MSNNALKSFFFLEISMDTMSNKIDLQKSVFQLLWKITIKAIRSLIKSKCQNQQKFTEVPKIEIKFHEILPVFNTVCCETTSEKKSKYCHEHIHPFGWWFILHIFAPQIKWKPWLLYQQHLNTISTQKRG